MFEVLFYTSAAVIGYLLGKNLKPTPLFLIFVSIGFVVYGLLSYDEGLAAIPGILAGAWFAVFLIAVLIGYYRSAQQTFIGDFLRNHIFR